MTDDQYSVVSGICTEPTTVATTAEIDIGIATEGDYPQYTYR